MKILSIFSFYALIAAIMLLPLSHDPFIPTSVDFLNHIQATIEAKSAVGDGQWWLRTALNFHGGIEYPLFQFYSPSSYFLTGLIYHLYPSGGPLIAMNVVLWFAMLLGGIYMYRLSRWLNYSDFTAVIVSIVFLTAPYQFIILFKLGGFNESVALNLLPVALYYGLQLFTKPFNWFLLLQFALTWYALATIHLLTFLSTIFSMGLVFLLMALTDRPRNTKKLFLVASGLLIGCLMAAWYLVPVILLSKYLNVSYSFSRPAAFFEHTSTLVDLLAPFALISGNKMTSDGFVDIISRTHPAIGLPIFFAVSFSLYRFKHLNSLQRILLLVFFILFFITWSPFNFWQWLPQSFLVLQYSWRLLGQLAWLGALLLGSVLQQLSVPYHQLRNGLALVITTYCIITALSLAPLTDAANFNDYLDTAPPGNWPFHIDVEKNPQLVQFKHTALDTSKVLFMSDCKQKHTTTVCVADVPPQIKLLELPVLYYPDLLNITVNGNPVLVMSVLAVEHLFAAVAPESGKINTVIIEYRGIFWANLFSQLAWLLWGLLLGYALIKSRWERS